jgi:hypothetical protein
LALKPILAVLERISEFVDEPLNGVLAVEPL